MEDEVEGETPKIVKKITNKQNRAIAPRNLTEILNQVDTEKTPERDANGSDEFKTPPRSKGSDNKYNHRIYSPMIEEPDSSLLEAIKEETAATFKFVEETISHSPNNINNINNITNSIRNNNNKRKQSGSNLPTYLILIFLLCVLIAFMVFSILQISTRNRISLYEALGVPTPMGAYPS